MKDLSLRNSVPFGILYNFVVRIWFIPLLGEKALLEILTMYTHVEKHFLWPSFALKESFQKSTKLVNNLGFVFKSNFKFP
jgi:hypothetical protein